MRVVLCLGCWGAVHGDGFVMCPGVSNEILDITGGTKRNADIVDHLDSHYGLFDKPLLNNVHTALFGLKEKFSTASSPLFGEKEFRRLERFCVAHAKCGLFLRLEMKGNGDEEGPGG